MMKLASVSISFCSKAHFHIQIVNKLRRLNSSGTCSIISRTFSDSYNSRYIDEESNRDRRFNNNYGYNRNKTLSNSYKRSNYNHHHDMYVGDYACSDFISKDYYKPSSVTESRSVQEVEAYRKKHDLTLKGSHIPSPILTFSEYEFPSYIQDYISKSGFEQPTPIQAQGWPIALSGTDLVGIGETGSGKTLAYMLPGLVHIQCQPELSAPTGPTVLVLAPTRELAQQIKQVTQYVTHHSDYRVACLYGGASKNVQMSHLREHPQICVATPGRLNDFLGMGATSLSNCSYVVLDEADRMLDMGFEPQIRDIFNFIRKEHQTLMWSATWPEEVNMLASDFQTTATHLFVGSSGLTANPNITQYVEVCQRIDMFKRFVEIVGEEMQKEAPRILVFCETKFEVDLVANKLRQQKIFARGIHGDRTQSQRDEALRAFKSGRSPILVATNVASRGIDVNDISLVMNYGMPSCVEDYVHRIGRTARAGKRGVSYTLFTYDSAHQAKKLVKVLQETQQEVDPELLQMADSHKSNTQSKKRFNYRRHSPPYKRPFNSRMDRY